MTWSLFTKLPTNAVYQIFPVPSKNRNKISKSCAQQQRLWNASSQSLCTREHNLPQLISPVTDVPPKKSTIIACKLDQIELVWNTNRWNESYWAWKSQQGTRKLFRAKEESLMKPLRNPQDTKGGKETHTNKRTHLLRERWWLVETLHEGEEEKQQEWSATRSRSKKKSRRLWRRRPLW
jgi:hypothetical protein